MHFPAEVLLRSEDAEAILEEARRSGGLECCGLLLGRLEGASAIVDEVLPAPNVAEAPGTSFEIDPAVLLAAHRTAREAGNSIVGWYHSHPNGNPAPSIRDAARAVEAGTVWLITAGEVLEAYCATEGGDIAGRFRRIAIRAI